ncbi:MAG: response regulator [Magnetospiraceae bacterium]
MTALDLSRLNILLVDDSQHMLVLLSSILNALGVRNIKQAPDGSDALAIMRDFPTDIVICDWLMKPTDGLTFTRVVRTAKDSPNPYIPIILLTAHTELSRVKEARDAGVNEVLAKPVAPKLMYDRLVRIIDNPRSFIQSLMYTGPDRRRKNVGPPKGEDRRDPNRETALLG